MREGSYAEQAAAIAVMRLVACIRVPVRRAFIGMGVSSLVMMLMGNAVGMNMRVGDCSVHMRRAVRIDKAMRYGIREGQRDGRNKDAECIESSHRKRRPPSHRAVQPYHHDAPSHHAQDANSSKSTRA